MREVRQDPTTGAWCVLSGDRGHRPIPLVTPVLADVGVCPFCPGNEGVTMPTLASVVGSEGWRVRAFPNRYPALAVEERGEVSRSGPYVKATGLGCHEVIAEARAHDARLWEQPEQHRLALRVAQERLADLWRDERLVHTTWFRNHGALAGASQPHPHAQIVGSAHLPSKVAEMAGRVAAWGGPGDLLGAMLARDEQEGTRVVGRVGDVVVVTPWAPSVSWEMWVVPCAGGARFFETGAVDDVADAMSMALAALHRVAPPPAYNAVLCTAPRGGERGFRWHIRLLPRRVALGGYEMMSGGTILHVSPEESASVLREAWGGRAGGL